MKREPFNKKRKPVRIVVFEHCDWDGVDLNLPNYSRKDPIFIHRANEIMKKATSQYADIHLYEFCYEDAEWYFGNDNPIIRFKQAIPFWLESNILIEEFALIENPTDPSDIKYNECALQFLDLCKQNNIDYVFDTHGD